MFAGLLLSAGVAWTVQSDSQLLGFARDNFAFLEFVEAVQNVAAQQEPSEIAGCFVLHAQRRLLGEFVVAGIEARPRLRDVSPAEPFEE